MKMITVPLVGFLCGLFVVFVAEFLLPFVLKQLGVNILG